MNDVEGAERIEEYWKDLQGAVINEVVGNLSKIVEAQDILTEEFRRCFYSGVVSAVHLIASVRHDELRQQERSRQLDVDLKAFAEDLEDGIQAG